MANRHLSRSIVLQTLFEWDFKDGKSFDVKKALKRNLEEFAPGLEEDAFVYALSDQILKKRKAIDEIIEKAAPEWPLNKISLVDRNVLRIGLTELLFGDRQQVPPKVAINEAIELAKTFGGENSGKFVNGVLGAVYKEIGEPGKEHQKEHPIISNRKKDSNSSKEPVDIAKLPVEKKGAALVYAQKNNKENGKIMFALVHDVFGYWTISKGGIEEEESEENATVREIKKEIGLDIKIEAKLGENEYVAAHPSKGKSLKKVVYFLAHSEYKELELEESGGLDGARWFEMAKVPELRLYNKYPNYTEGELTALRSALVNAVIISEIASGIGMNDYLLLSKGEHKDNGKARQYILANTYEAYIGAIYLDQGIETVDKFVCKTLLPNTEEIVRKKLWRDAKSLVQEKAQDFVNFTPAYKVLRESGPDHDKNFTVGIYFGPNLIAEGKGQSKQEAEQSAALAALKVKNWLD